MNNEAAALLVLKISRRGLVARIVKGHSQKQATRIGGRLTWKLVDSYSVVFSGGTSSHSIDLATSSRERILAHWDGYCQANGLRSRPRVDEAVGFVSRSASKAMMGCRPGRVVAVTATTVTVGYWFKSRLERIAKGLIGTEESRSFVTVPISKVSF